jgi:hypothetical protein
MHRWNVVEERHVGDTSSPTIYSKRHVAYDVATRRQNMREQARIHRVYVLVTQTSSRYRFISQQARIHS